jgi:hypothetical protein
MIIDKNYADNFLKICEKSGFSEWADELHIISGLRSMDIETSTLREVQALAAVK